MQDSNSFVRDSESAHRFGDTDHCIFYADAEVVSHPSTVSEAADTLHAASTDPNSKAFLWIDMLRPTPQELAEVGSRFHLHQRAVEDAVAAHQRPEYHHYGPGLLLSSGSRTPIR